MKIYFSARHQLLLVQGVGCMDHPYLLVGCMNHPYTWWPYFLMVAWTTLTSRGLNRPSYTLEGYMVQSYLSWGLHATPLPLVVAWTTLTFRGLNKPSYLWWLHGPPLLPVGCIHDHPYPMWVAWNTPTPCFFAWSTSTPWARLLKSGFNLTQG